MPELHKKNLCDLAALSRHYTCVLYRDVVIVTAHSKSLRKRYLSSPFFTSFADTVKFTYRLLVLF